MTNGPEPSPENIARRVAGAAPDGKPPPQAAPPPAPGRQAQSQSAAPDLPGFAPWPGFLGIAALILVPFALARDLATSLIERMSLGIDGLEPVIGQWGIELAGRMIGDPLRLGFALLLVTALVYGVLQLAGLAADGALGRGRAAAWTRAARTLSGRPAGVPRQRYLQASLGWGSDALLAPLRLGVTLFPMLGFLGTVIGLSGAIADLPEAVQDKDKLDPVLQDLYVAFDTTFLGLLGAILCLILVRLAEGRIDWLARRMAAD